MTCQDPDLRITNDSFRLAFCRKLHLPILPPILRSRPCSCGAPLDQYGDHFFHCKNFAKSRPSNRIRDALYLILRTLAPIAEFVSTGSDVLLEPHHLLAQHPSSRPADVALLLHPSYPSAHNSPFKLAAIDITIPPLLPGSSHCADSHNFAVAACRQHLTVERLKFNGRDVRSHGTLITGQYKIDACNHHRILLIPFSVDPLGGLGPLAHSFLYHSAYPGPPLERHFSHPSAALAYSNATGPNSLSGLLPYANKHWSSSNPDCWFTSTYFCPTPTTWAHQILGLNCLSAFTAHLRTSISACISPILQPRSPPAHILGQHSRFPYTSPSSRAGNHAGPSSRATLTPYVVSGKRTPR